DALHILECGFEVDHSRSRYDVLRSPRPVLAGIGAPRPLRRVRLFHPSDVFAGNREDVSVRKPDELPHFGPAFHGGVTEVKIHADMLWVEVFYRQPEIPASAADISRAAFNVIDGRRAVFLVELCEFLDARPPNVELRLKILGVVILREGGGLIV